MSNGISTIPPAVYRSSSGLTNMPLRYIGVGLRSFGGLKSRVPTGGSSLPVTIFRTLEATARRGFPFCVVGSGFCTFGFGYSLSGNIGGSVSGCKSRNDIGSLIPETTIPRKTSFREEREETFLLYLQLHQSPYHFPDVQIQ